MYESMLDAETNHVITHENDRLWRDSVVLNRPSLLALRYVCAHTGAAGYMRLYNNRYQRSDDTYIDPYKIIRLNSKFVKFRLIKVTCTILSNIILLPVYLYH